MKNVVHFTATLALLVAFLPTVATSSSAMQVPDGRWLYGAGSYARALELQRELQVPLIVYFYTDWCPYCHSLDVDYLPSAPVQEYLRGVVKIRINPENGPSDRDLANRYGVTGYPSFFVIGVPDGFPNSINPFRKSGLNLTPAQFAEACRQAGSHSRQPTPVARQPQAAPFRMPKSATIVEVPPLANTARNAITEAPLPAVDAILTKYVEATGGASVQNRVTSRVVKGKIDVAGVSFGGRFEVYAKSAGKSLAVIDVEPIGLVKHCVDGRTAWFHAGNGSQNMNTPELAVLAAADLFREARLANMYARLKVLSKVKEGYRDVYVVEAAPRTGTPDTLYFDAQSGLLLHRDLTRQTSRGPIKSQVYYGDWRKVDGVLLPFRLTQTTADRTFVITLDEIKLNVAVDDTVFQRPAN
jgi:thiol-disulfide isomerase/thioredoxin